MNKLNVWAYPFAVIAGWLLLTSLTLHELGTLPRSLSTTTTHQQTRT